MAIVAVAQIRPALAEPGDIFTTAAPAAGTAPPTATPIQDGDASVSATGALKYGYPIEVPPGRNGMQPHLSLAYSSDAPIYGGLAAGWSLSGIPIITLDTSQGRLLGPTYQSSMAGGRPLVSVDEGDGMTAYRAQNDSSWVRYQKMPSGNSYPWKALAPDGTIYYFGDHGASDNHTVGCANIDDEYAPLTRMSDGFGNLVEYFYKPGVSGECRIDYITWGQNGPAGISDFARVTFSYNDPAPACAGVPVGSLTSYRSGKQIVTGGSELSAITATAYEPGQYSNAEHTRVVTLTYSSTDKSCTVNHGAFRSLVSIQESAFGATPDMPSVALPPVTFTYGDVNLQYPTAVPHSLPWPLGPVSGVDGYALSSGLRPHADGEWPTVEDMLLDVDGDGLVDRIVSAPTSYDSATNTPVQCRAQWFKNLGNFRFDTNARYIPLPTLKWAHDPSDQSDPFSGAGSPGVYPGEAGWERCALNYQSTAFTNSFYDGAADCPAGGSCANGTCPNGTDCPAPQPAGASQNGHSHTYLSYRWMDLNGDGLVDLVAGLAEGGLALYNLQRGNGIPGGPIPEPTDEPQIFGSFPSCPSDRAGAIARGKYTMCNGLYPWFVYLNHGNGTFGYHGIHLNDPMLPDEIKYQPIPLETDQGDSSLTSLPNGEMQGLVDLDGDGRVDATLAPSYLTPSAFGVFRSSTSGTFGDSSSVPFSYAAAPSDLLSRTDCTTFNSCWPIGTQGLLDVNGDGLPDHWTVGSDATTATVDFNDGTNFTNFAGGDQVGPLSARPGTDWIREVWSTPCPPNQSCSVINSGARALTSRVFDMDSDGRSDVLQITNPGHCQLGGQSCTATQACASGDMCIFPLPSPFATHYNEGGQLCTYGQNLNCGQIANGAPVNALANVTVVGGVDPAWYWEARADLLDLDGDAIPDSIDFDGAAAGEPPATNPRSLYLSKIATPTQPARLLATIDNHRGATTTVTYATSTSATVEQHPELGRTLPQVRWVVQNLSNADAISATSSMTSYHYVSPEYIADDRGTYGFRGFDEIETSLPSGATRVDRYDFTTDWSGRLTQTLLRPSAAEMTVPNEVRSIDTTTWEKRELFPGQLTTYHPTVVEHYTCANGQDESTCTPTAAAAYSKTSSELTPMASTTGGGATPLLYVETRSSQQLGAVAGDGDRQVLQTYALDADGSTYRLRPLVTTKQSVTGGNWTTYAQTGTRWSANYLTPDYSDVWFGGTSLDSCAQADTGCATTARVFDPLTGNLLRRTKPNQYSGDGRYASYSYDGRQLFVASETDEAAGYPLSSMELDYTWEYGTGTKITTLGPNVPYCATLQPSTCPAGSPPKQEKKLRIDGLGRPLERWETFGDGTSYYTLYELETNTYSVPDYAVMPAAASVTHFRAITASGTTVGLWAQDMTEVDGHGRPIRKTVYTQGTAPANAITTFNYTNAGTLASVSVPDPSANDATTVMYTYGFDSLGRATRLRRPGGLTGVDIAYDGMTITTSEIAGDGGPAAVTKSIKDSLGRLKELDEQTSASPTTAWATTLYTYGPDDNVQVITDPEGQVTSLTHDLAGRRIGITRGTRTWLYQYDKNGNLSTETVPGWTSLADKPDFTTSTAYDDLDRPLTKSIGQRTLSSADRTLFGNATEAFTWDYGVAGHTGDYKGQLIYWSTAPVGGASTVYFAATYDAQGNLWNDQESFAGAGYNLSRQVRRSYSLSGYPVYTHYGDWLGGNTNYTAAGVTQDARGFPSSVSVTRTGYSPLTLAVETRNVAGLVTKVRNNISGQPISFVESNWTYDTLGRVASQVVQTSAGPVAQQSLAYFGTDDPSTLDQYLGANHKTFQFTYDLRHQLKTAAESTTPGYFSASYAYGPSGTGGAGRFDSATVSAAAAPGGDIKPRDVTYKYEGDDPEEVTRLVNASGPNVGQDYATYAYDAAGNQTLRCYGVITSGACNGEATAYVYDGKDQLRRATHLSSAGATLGSEEYWYAEGGRRIATVKRDSAGNKTELIFWIGDVEAHYDGAGNGTAVYSYISVGTSVARVDRQSNTVSPIEYQFHGLGNSTLASVDPSGAVNASFSYAPFGDVIEAVDGGGMMSGVAAQRRRMNDKFVDEISELSYYGARYYDPTSMTWTQGDPLYRFLPDAEKSTPRRASLYTFSLQNPLRYYDPDGRDGAPSVWNPSGNDPRCNGRTSVCEDGDGTGRGSHTEDPKPYTDPAIYFPSKRTVAIAILAPFVAVPIVRWPAIILLGGLTGGESAGCVAGCSVAGGPGAAGADTATTDVAGAGAADEAKVITDPSRQLPERAGPTGHISPKEVAGKTPAEIDARAQELGLSPRGPDPAGGKGAYIDPQTGQQRILVHPPHGHVNNPAGLRIDIHGDVVEPESAAAHLPLKGR